MAVDPSNQIAPLARRSGRERWWGLAIGAAGGFGDMIFSIAIGIRFEMNGRDVTVTALGLYALTFTALGFAFGLVQEGRRREREAAAVIQSQLEAIAGARARLAQSEKLAALGQLAAAIAHEVRNALGVIRSSAQGLAESLPAGDADAQRASSFIVAEIDRLGSVVNSLLGFARPLRLAPRTVLPAALLEQAALLAQEELAGKGIRLTTATADELPAIEADSDLLVQVLLGLITNAVESVPAGGAIELEAKRVAGGVEIAIGDSGPGVPVELRGRVFEPFFTTRERGTGLGLAVARHIVEAHGGRIEVGEARGGGARFALVMPASPARVREPRAAA